MCKLPIPTYRSDEFMGKTHVAGLNDVNRLPITDWYDERELFPM